MSVMPKPPREQEQGQAIRDFETLVVEEGPRVVRFLERFRVRGETAEDLCQEVFVHVLRHEGRWPPPDRMMVWIFRIARNVALDALRRERVKSRTREAFEALVRWQEDRRLRQATAPPLEALSREEIRKTLDEAIHELPEVYRTAFILREQEGLSYEEVAAILEIPAKTVSTRLVRARQRLERHLAAWHADEVPSAEAHLEMEVQG